MQRLLPSCAVICAVLACAAPVARGTVAVKINHYGSGAVAAYNTCTPEPDGNLLCDDHFVFFGRSGSTADGVSRDPLGVSLEHYMGFIHPDGSADEFVAEIGISDQVSGFYDRARLTFARMGGATLALNDIDPVTGALVPNGRTATLGPFEWSAASPPYVFGNDGPFGFGLARHFVDHCVTALENAHERFTTAHVTGTINGISVANYGPAYLPWPGTGPADALGAIFDNRFTVRVVPHGPGC
jgi:hypothetical protein